MNKIYTSIITNCSDCPDTHIQHGSNETKWGVCNHLRRRVYDIAEAVYDPIKDALNCNDDIPNDCPLKDFK